MSPGVMEATWDATGDAMSGAAWSCAAALLLGLGCAGCGYTVFAVVCVNRFFARRRIASLQHPGVTHLKPLAPECGLAENLHSFCTQRYEGPVQIVLGVADEAAASAADEFASTCSTKHVDVVACNPTSGHANPKIAKLVMMAPYAMHEVLVLSDGDIVAGPEDLATIVGELYQPSVGAVTCLYHGIARAGVWSRLAVMQIDHHFLPSVLVGQALGLADSCFGSTIAMSRQTLDRIGGFAAFGAHLADDHAIGAAVRGLGLRVVISRAVVGHVCPESSLRALVQHELRWARTVLALNPRGHVGSIIAHPVPLAVLATACATLAGPPWVIAGVVLLAAALASRSALRRRIDAGLQIPHRRAWLSPVRDMLSFFVFVASFFVGAVTWRGRRYRVAADGTVVALAES
jgi:ceramide glucosyltransferase